MTELEKQPDSSSPRSPRTTGQIPVHPAIPRATHHKHVTQRPRTHRRTRQQVRDHKTAREREGNNYTVRVCLTARREPANTPHPSSTTPVAMGAACLWGSSHKCRWVTCHVPTQMPCRASAGTFCACQFACCGPTQLSNCI